MFVFCRLTWYEARRRSGRGPSSATSAPWANRGGGPGQAPAQPRESGEEGAPRQRPEGQAGLEARQRRELPGEESAAAAELGRARAVVGRGAADGGRHEDAREDEAVVQPDRRRLVGQARAVEGREEEVPRGVPGEDAAGPVPSVRGRGEPDDGQPGVGVAEAGDRARPVGLPAEAPGRVRRRLLAPGHEARAGPAGDHLGGDLLQPGAVRGVGPGAALLPQVLTSGRPWASLTEPVAIRMTSISHQIPHPPNVTSLAIPRPMCPR